MAGLLVLSVCLPARAADMQSMADAIRTEATRSNQDPSGRPLPLASTWVTGNEDLPGSVPWRPTNQLQLIGQGHYILPVIDLPCGDDSQWFSDYFQNSMQTMAALHLPLTLKATQFEYALSEDPYLSLPANQNPNVVLANGKIQAAVSPFGPLNLWHQVGTAWTTASPIQDLEAWYPDPPKVVFLSNNEQPALKWTDLPNTMQYVTTLHQPGTPDLSMEAMRGVVAGGFTQCYRSLQQGMKDGLANGTWKNNSIFVGYNAFGPDNLGRYSDWILFCLCRTSIPMMDPAPLEWDGGSPSYYTNNWDAPTDFQVLSPQISFMNYLFMQNEAWSLNPSFWFEFSVWDGFPGKIESYHDLGQTYDPTRYSGWVQFGTWLTRPRVVREWRDCTDSFTAPRGYGDTYSDGDYYMALVGVVDRVHTNPILTDWWRKGTLVPNRAHPHPFQANIPDAYQSADRWFLLDCDANPDYPWDDLSAYVNVYSLAYTRGTAPAREWLVYAHAPLGDMTGVALTIPNYQDIIVDVPKGGVFYMVDEKTGKVRNVTSGPPYSLVYMAGPHGSISGASPQTVAAGGSGSEVTAVPAAGYRFVQWSDRSLANPRVDSNVGAMLSVTASFATTATILQYHLAYAAGPNGSVAGATSQTVALGESGLAVTAVPRQGYHFVQWSDGSTRNPRTDADVMEDLSVTATFAINTYSVHFRTDGTPGAALSGATAQTVLYGADCTTVTAHAPTGMSLQVWRGTGGELLATNPLVLRDITHATTVTRAFRSDPGYAVVAFRTDGTPGATLLGSSIQIVPYGNATSPVLAVPPPLSVLENWVRDGVLYSNANPATVVAGTTDTTLTAVFVHTMAPASVRNWFFYR